MTRIVTDHAASARARLLNVAKARGVDFQFILQRYVAERFLYRLGSSPQRTRFVLKGALLFALWDESLSRPTRDLDLAGYWDNEADSLAAAVREILAYPSPLDGVEFVADTLQLSPIRHATQYHGFRIELQARLAAAVIAFQVDVGFGDAIVPGAEEVVFPVLLPAEPPRVRAYPREVSLAEKLHAMVVHGALNSRYKDFFDAWLLSARFAFAGDRMAAAIAATFARRGTTSFDPWPVALLDPFYADPARDQQWRRYCERNKLQAPARFAEAGAKIAEFFGPPVQAVAAAQHFPLRWPPGGPWRSADPGAG